MIKNLFSAKTQKASKFNSNTIMFLILFLFTAMFFFPSPAPCKEMATTDDEQITGVVQKFEGIADDIFRRSNVPGAAVAVVHNDKVVFLKCYGVKKAGTSDKVNPDTVFQIASCSKAFSSAVIASLVKDGVMNWDDKVTKHFPDFKLYDPEVTKEMTIRDLLSHHSGLPEYAGDTLSEVFNYNRKEILYRLRYLKPSGEFRKTYAYQNFLITAAIEAASRASGRKWDNLFKEKIFIPLKMKSTGILHSHLMKSKNKAESHKIIDGKMTPYPAYNDEKCAPAGGISSSVNDMTKWLRMLLADGIFEGSIIVDSEALAETFKPQTLIKRDEKSSSSYGLCWFVNESDGIVSVEHGGDLSNGISSLVYMIPSENLGMVVLTNAFPEGHILTHSLSASLKDLYIKGESSKDWMTEIQKKMKEAMSGKTVLDPFDHLPQRPSDAKTNDRLTLYTGEYENSYYGKVTVREENGNLTIYFAKEGPLQLFPYDGDTFQEKNTNTGVIFTRDEKANVSGVTVKLLDFKGRDGNFVRK